MASINAEGFIISPQDFSGAYKLADTLGQQRAEREKEKARVAANKKLLGAAVEDIDPKDFMTNTLEDGVITSKIYDLKDKLNKFIVENPQIDQASLNSMIAQKVRGIATASQNIKEIKRKADNAWEEIKTNPSADKDKFYKEWNRAFQNQDGSVREDIENIDPTFDYTSTILKNGDIWNNGAIYSALENAAKGAVGYKDKKLIRDASGKSVMRDFEFTHSDFLAPKIDETGHFTNDFEPANYRKAQDVSGNILQVPKQDANGNTIIDPKTKKPIMEDQKLIGDNSWFYLKEGNPQTKPVINSMLIRYGKENGVDPNSIQAENAVRNQLFRIVDTYPKRARVSIIEEAKQPLPSRISVNVGGKGDGTTGYNPIYQKLDKIATDLIENKRYNFIPINKLPGDVAEAVKNSYASAMGKDPKETSTSEFAINRLDNGEWGLFSAEGGKPVGNVVKTLSEDELNLGAAKGKERKPILSTETKMPKEYQKGKTSRTYKSYDGKTYTYQQLIKAGYTDADIQQAIKSGNIK